MRLKLINKIWFDLHQIIIHIPNIIDNNVNIFKLIKWFKLDCSKSSKGKKGGLKGSMNPKSMKGNSGKTKSNSNSPNRRP